MIYGKMGGLKAEREETKYERRETQRERNRGMRGVAKDTERKWGRGDRLVYGPETEILRAPETFQIPF